MEKEIFLRTLSRRSKPLRTQSTGNGDSLCFIKDIGKRISEQTGDKRATTFLFQALGIANQRGNSASIAGTVPSMKKLDEIYYL